MAPGPHADSLNILENLALESQITTCLITYVVPFLDQVSWPPSPPSPICSDLKVLGAHFGTQVSRLTV